MPRCTGRQQLFKVATVFPLGTLRTKHAREPAISHGLQVFCLLGISRQATRPVGPRSESLFDGDLRNRTDRRHTDPAKQTGSPISGIAGAGHTVSRSRAPRPDQIITVSKTKAQLNTASRQKQGKTGRAGAGAAVVGGRIAFSWWGRLALRIIAPQTVLFQGEHLPHWPARGRGSESALVLFWQAASRRWANAWEPGPHDLEVTKTPFSRRS